MAYSYEREELIDIHVELSPCAQLKEKPDTPEYAALYLADVSQQGCSPRAAPRIKISPATNFTQKCW